MADKQLPSPETLRQLLRYDPETGKLFWRERDATFFQDGKFCAAVKCRQWNTRYANKEALTNKTPRGYCYGSIFHCKHYAHRVVWAIVHGEWPDGEIDHVSGDTQDNSIANLRIVSHTGNMRNTKRPSHNTSGVVGVSIHKPNGKWRAVIGVGGKAVSLGIFADLNDAIAARKNAETKYGFHQNHGRA